MVSVVSVVRVVAVVAVVSVVSVVSVVAVVAVVSVIWRYQPTRTLRSSSCSYFTVTNCSTNANHAGIDLLLLPLPSYGTR